MFGNDKDDLLFKVNVTIPARIQAFLSPSEDAMLSAVFGKNSMIRYMTFPEQIMCNWDTYLSASS